MAQFEPGDFVCVALDSGDPAGDLMGREPTVWGIGRVVKYIQRSSLLICVQWISAPLHVYYDHYDDKCDVFIAPGRCTKLGEVPHG